MADVFAVLDDERDVEDKDHGQDLDGIDQGSAAGDEAGDLNIQWQKVLKRVLINQLLCGLFFGQI